MIRFDPSFRYWLGSDTPTNQDHVYQNAVNCNGKTLVSIFFLFTLHSSLPSLITLSLIPQMLSSPYVLSFSLLLSLPILFLLLILHPRTPLPPPIPLSDEISDHSLFTRASSFSYSRSRLSSPNPRLKIAFLFLTNSDLHFSPLWSHFFINQSHSSQYYNIYIHADPTANITLPPRGTTDDTVFDRAQLIPSKRTFRASPTLVSAARRLIATAIIDDPANAFFALLSQHCIPLHSFNYVYNSIVTSTTFDFSSSSSSSSSDPSSSFQNIRLRYKSFIEVISDDPRLWKRYVARGRYAMTPEVPFDKFRVGSQFYVLTRKHAVLVVKDRTLWRKFKKPCYRADECYPEEHYFPTLLSMQDPDGLTRYTLTRVNWTGAIDGHPYTYKPNEVSPELIYKLRESNYSESYLFARKFSPDCLRPLMKIADSVIFRD